MQTKRRAMTKTLLFSAAVTLVTALAASAADAQTTAAAGQGAGWKARQMQRAWAARAWQRQLRGIGLDESQRAQVRQLVQEHRSGLRKLARNTLALRRSLNEVIRADKFDEAAIRKRAAEVATSQADLAVARARLRTTIMGVLTPEQQQLLRDRQQKMREQMQRRRQQRLG